MKRLTFFLTLISMLGAALNMTACTNNTISLAATPTQPQLSFGMTPTPDTRTPAPTPMPTRETFSPGQIVAYTVQTGDTLPALAARFNTTISELFDANPNIPEAVTTLPPGMPIQIPIYYRSFWGSAYQIIPDSLYINGPLAAEFNTEIFVSEYPGWLGQYTEYAAGDNRSGAEIVDYVATNFSVSPYVLLALLEHQSGALSQSQIDPELIDYPLGYIDRNHRGMYLQLVWAANQLNNGYYQWRMGELIEFELQDGTLERPDPWQNAATVAFQYLYKDLSHQTSAYRQNTGPTGIALTFNSLYEDVWALDSPHIPGSLAQPLFTLPFTGGETWAFTGAAHTGWGTGAPLAALDFAPPSNTSGCFNTDKWATAVADGLIIRDGEGLIILDLDMDGDERTGWVILYLHLAAFERVQMGTVVKQGDPLGHPSCEGGTSTGSHVHMARKYNGEWLIADWSVPFVMEGWLPINGENIYQGELVRYEKRVIACVCSDQDSWITASGYADGVFRDQ